MSRMKWTCSLVAALLTCAGSLAGADRVALVIGNNDYPDEGNFPDLSNCRNDATLIKTSLERAGFTVIYLENADWQRIDEGVTTFENAISRGGTAVFYFAGHGIEFEGKNYLMGTNAKLLARSRLGQEGYDAETVAQAMLLAGAKSSFLFLDCCRDAPADAGWLSRGVKKRGLADLKISGDIVIGFAATPGQSALDAPVEGVTGATGNNSPYAQALAKAFHAGLDHLAMFQKVRADVNTLTGGQQRTWESGSFLETFYFTRGTAHVEPMPAAAAARPQIDPGFGVGGRVHTSYGYGGGEDSYSVAMQSDGSLIIAGEAEKAFKKGSFQVALARITPSGTSDTSFGQSGRTVLNIGPFDDGIRGTTLAVQSDGRIVYGARASVDGYGYDFAVGRLLPDGSRDQTFGQNGFAVTNITGTKPPQLRSAEVQELRLQPDGKILAAGRSNLNEALGDAFTLVRYLPRGGLDSSFGNGGIVRTAYSTKLQEVYGMTLMDDGRIVLCGKAFGPGEMDAVILRYHSNGTLDKTFGRDGLIVLNLGAKSYDVGSVVVAQGNKLVATIGSDVFPSAALMRFNEDGSIDRSFGGGKGHVIPGGEFRGPVLTADGRLLVVLMKDYSVKLYTADGQPSTEVPSNDTPRPVAETMRSMILAPDGRLVLTGYTRLEEGRTVPTTIRLRGLNP